MKLPEEILLMSLFECEPQMLDKDIPFYYNEATFKFYNKNDEKFLVRICPSYGDIKVEVSTVDTDEYISIIEIRSVQSLEILCDKKDESKILITGKNCYAKINFKPRFKILMRLNFET